GDLPGAAWLRPQVQQSIRGQSGKNLSCVAPLFYEAMMIRALILPEGRRPESLDRCVFYRVSACGFHLSTVLASVHAVKSLPLRWREVWRRHETKADFLRGYTSVLY